MVVWEERERWSREGQEGEVTRRQRTALGCNSGGGFMGIHICQNLPNYAF